MKYWVQQIAGMKLSTPTLSVSVGKQLLSFCFVELTIENPCTKDKPSPEYNFILGWTANDSSTDHVKISLLLALRVMGSMRVLMMYPINGIAWTNRLCWERILSLSKIQWPYRYLVLIVWWHINYFPLDCGILILCSDSVSCIPC